MQKLYNSLREAEADITKEQPRLIFLTGKTSSGKTYLSERLVNQEYKLVRLDEIIFKDVMQKFKIVESNVAFATYRGNAPLEWIESFVKSARKIILSTLKSGKVVVEGALANNEMIQAIFTQELADFEFIFLLPTNVEIYAERITKRFIFETETGKTGLPKEFFQMVDKDEIDLYKISKQISELLEEKILKFATWSLEESERRLKYFKEKFTDVVVVEV